MTRRAQWAFAGVLTALVALDARADEAKLEAPVVDEGFVDDGGGALLGPHDLESQLTLFGVTVEVTPLLPARDHYVVAPFTVRAFGEGPQVGTTVRPRLCLDDDCEVFDELVVPVGTRAAPRPAVRHVAAGMPLIFGDDAPSTRGVRGDDSDGQARIAVVGDEPLVIPAASPVFPADKAVASGPPGAVVPVLVDATVLEEPGLVFAWDVVSVAPGTPRTPVAVVELRRFLRAGRTVIGDAAWREALVVARDPSAKAAQVLDGTRALGKSGALVTPDPTSALIAHPTGQLLRAGPRGPLPVRVVDEGGGMFLERLDGVSGEDLIDAVLAVGVRKAGYRMYGAASVDPPVVVAGDALVASIMPWRAVLLLLVCLVAVMALVLHRHKGGGRPRAFLVETLLAAGAFSAAVFVAAGLERRDAQGGELVSWTVRQGAEVAWEVGARVHRAPSRGTPHVVKGSPGRTLAPRVRGDMFGGRAAVRHLPDGGFALDATPDTALVGVWTRPARLPGALRLERDDRGVVEAFLHELPFVLDEVVLLRGTTTYRARDVGPGTRVMVSTLSTLDEPREPATRREAAKARLLSELLNRNRHDDDERVAVWVAVGEHEGRIVGIEATP